MRKEKITKCVMIGAPHTSNWDIVYLVAAFELMKIPLRFTVKKEWMRFPQSILIKPLGGIGIDRTPKPGSTKKRSMVDVITELFNDIEDLAIIFTPEGTRSRRDKWRTGFYHTAVNANVPILLGYLDYKRRIAGIGKIIHPTGDIRKDMKLLYDFYENITPKFPGLFALDKEYAN